MRLKRIFGIFENVLFRENDIFSLFTLFGYFWRHFWARNDVTVPPFCPSSGKLLNQDPRDSVGTCTPYGLGGVMFQHESLDDQEVVI